MAPVLIVPFMGTAEALAAFCATIDIPVRLVVVDNTTEGIAADVVPDDAWVVEPPGNLGFGPSVNLVIKALHDEPYWLVANHDVSFAPGDLSRLVGATESGEWGWVGINDWRVFGLAAETVLRVGFFDEHFVPAYCEDADYERRCTLAGIRWGAIPGETTHVGSILIKSDYGYAADNRRSYPANVAYYCAKWGVPGVRHDGGYTTPFDLGGRLDAGTHADLSVLRANAWGRDRRAGG